MEFVLKPSLEHMTLVQIAISLWNQNDVRALIIKHSFEYPYLNKNIKTIEERVIEKVSQLSLPQLLKEKVFGVIKPIGIEIFEWMQYYHKYDTCMEFEYDLHLDLPAHLPAELCWTPLGTVDRKRTAEVLVRDESLDVFRRYRLACEYFLEDDIIRLWNRLPKDIKDYAWHDFPVISFWSDNMKRGGAGHMSCKRAFSSSVRDSNKVAAKYFLQKLTPQEREECLKLLSICLKKADVLCFLLPEIEEEQQKEVFKSNCNRVLQCFLQWPWQSLFIQVTNCLWDFLSRKNYDEILGAIIGKVREGYKDYNYQKLFRECWQKVPSAIKDSFLGEIDDSWILQCLLDIKDKENIRLILKDATLTAKSKLIYSDEIKNFCKRSIRDNEWDFLDFLIRECLPSKNEMLKFKDEFEKCIYFKVYCSATKKHKWNLMLCYSDDSIYKYDKRSVEEDKRRSSKQFQSLQ